MSGKIDAKSEKFRIFKIQHEKGLLWYLKYYTDSNSRWAVNRVAGGRGGLKILRVNNKPLFTNLLFCDVTLSWLKDVFFRRKC